MEDANRDNRDVTTVEPGSPRRSDVSTDTAFRALVRSYGLVNHAMQPYFMRFGISGSQWGVLRALHRAEQEGIAVMRLTDLGARLLIRPPSVSGVVNRLERMGLVRRTPASDDLRVKNVGLTPLGRQRVHSVLEGLAEQVRSVLGGLDLAEQHQLQRLLERLNAHLQAMTDYGGDGRP
jgi:DNA-binding MarR family transcriptional regulator